MMFLQFLWLQEVLDPCKLIETQLCQGMLVMIIKCFTWLKGLFYVHQHASSFLVWLSFSFDVVFYDGKDYDTLHMSTSWMKCDKLG